MVITSKENSLEPLQIIKTRCQKWDSNPRPQMWTAIWTQRFHCATLLARKLIGLQSNPYEGILIWKEQSKWVFSCIWSKCSVNNENVFGWSVIFFHKKKIRSYRDLNSDRWIFFSRFGTIMVLFSLFYLGYYILLYYLQWYIYVREVHFMSCFKVISY